jgi:hypothetical protein
MMENCATRVLGAPVYNVCAWKLEVQNGNLA